jgi:dTDP-4-dehydrorhamnose reductase
VKYLVIGARGQLGRDLCPRLRGDVVAASRDSADLTNPALLRTTLAAERPDIVVNCAAYNLVDKAEAEPETAFAINAFGVRTLANLCAEFNITLVHFSSDYVFGLDNGRRLPWSEADVPVPNSVYAASKLTGEHFVRSICSKHIVIRTCGLYGVWGTGGKGGNFVETMLRLGGEKKPLRVVADQICTPTYTLDLAGAVTNLLGTGKHGLYHVTSGGSCTWHEFASTIFQLSEMKVDVAAISTAEFGAAARRPVYSVLSCAKFAALGIEPLREWKAALAAYLQERRARK